MTDDELQENEADTEEKQEELHELEEDRQEDGEILDEETAESSADILRGNAPEQEDEPGEFTEEDEE